MRAIGSIAAVASVASYLFGLTPAAFGQQTQNPIRFDLSPPLRSIQPPLRAQGVFLVEHRVKKLPRLPVKLAVRPDSVLQNQAARILPIEPFAVIPGIGHDTNYSITSDPPDTNGSVGRMHYVQWVNTGLAIFDKSTRKSVLGPVDGNLLWTGFGGNCEQFNDGDPIVLYDKAADRWLLTQFAVRGTPFSQCVAVSTSGDPTDTYARYEYQFQDFNDYPKFGVWPDAYYGTFNMFRGGTAFVGAKVCAFEREKMIAAASARMQCFDLANQGGILPADLDGATSPPAGSPNYLMNFGNDQLNLWTFHVDWTNPASSTFTGPTTISTAPFEIACNNAASPGQCVTQPNTPEQLDTLSDRLMFRLAYRNFGDHEVLVVNHAVATAASSGVRWYEVRNLSGAPTIFQQGTFALDNAFRFMGSIAMDKAHNMLMGYSVSGPQTFPSIRFTGRIASDPLNQMAAEQAAVSGAGSQTSPERWGDYASMSLDPTDDCTFWFSTQYIGESGSFNWQTSIVPVKFSNCH
jgi:hypothetical protein